jgi:hypothetical protein
MLMLSLNRYNIETLPVYMINLFIGKMWEAAHGGNYAGARRTRLS